MDDINKDVNNPTDIASPLIITDAMTSSAFSTTGGDFALYASLYIEHNVGIWDQFFQSEIRTTGPTSSSTYNNSWASIYANLYALKKIITKCSDGGSEAGNYHTLGIAEILTAYNLAFLTDGMGDVPWTKALQPGQTNSPVLDSQETIYNEVFRILDDALTNLEKTSVYPSLGSHDPIYGGDVALWKKFAYGLKARYTMRLSYRNPDYNSVIAFADQSFSSASEQAQFKYNGASSNSPFYRFLKDRDYFGASQSLHNKLVERNDPRDDVFFRPHPNTGSELVFAPNGSPNQMQGFYSVSAISTSTAPTYLLSYHELQFLKAEAYARLNNLSLADSALRKGITAAFGKVNIHLPSAQALLYMNTSVRQRFNLDPISEIMNQKYLAFYEEEAMEAYNDYRRLKAMGNDVIELENPMNANMFPLRFSYGTGDVTTNENIRNAYGDGTYVYSQNVWWAGGSR
jgi:hypothetical protein